MAWDSIRQNNETERNRKREPKPEGKHFMYLFSRFIGQTNKKLSKYNVDRLLYFAIKSTESDTEKELIQKK